METKKIVLNPKYILKNDIHRIVLTTKNDNSLTSFIHPLHAMILSFFDKPLFLEDAINLISSALLLPEKNIKEFLQQLINNDTKKWIGQGKNTCQYPENTLINEPSKYIARNYNFRDFIIKDVDLDFINPRLYILIDTMMMINTLCYTNCIYCYADRSKKYDLKIPFERISEIIDEAKNLKLKNFDISGGEFFLYKNWEALLKKLLLSGFSPQSIPTKIPLSIETIKKISDLGYNEIQISLDSIDKPTLSKLLNVDNYYLDNIENMIFNLQKFKQKFRVNTVITSYNCSIEKIDSLIKYLKSFDNFSEISIGIVGYSIYKNNKINYSNFPKIDDANILYDFLKIKYLNDEQVVISDITKQEDNLNYTTENFFNKAMCTGNLHSFYILPDGKVTICEELYWHPKFIIGDLLNQNIMDIWNSETSMNLYNLSQPNISEKSPCKVCNNFNRCHKYGGICWKEVIKSYGKENWDYPDPRCNYAPKVINKIFI